MFTLISGLFFFFFTPETMGKTVEEIRKDFETKTESCQVHNAKENKDCESTPTKKLTEVFSSLIV